MHDSIQLLAKALHDMGRSQEVTPKSLSCDGSDIWTQGINLINFMKSVRRERYSTILLQLLNGSIFLAD